MAGLAVPPMILSLAIDEGIRDGSSADVWIWAGALLLVGLVVAALAILRHRTMTRVRIEAALQTIETAARQSVRLGASLSRRATAGEVATIGVGDAWAMAMALTVTGPGVGAVVAYIVIAIALFQISPLLAAIILFGMPLLLLLLGPLLDSFRTRGADYREAQGSLSNRIVDIISGLRVLNTLGGKEIFADRWERDSVAVRRAGYRVATTESWIRGISVGLPALFLAVIVWIAARLAAEDALSLGELVAVYGYVAVAAVPIASFIEGAVDVNRALVSARRTVDFLAIDPPPGGEAEIRDTHAPVVDPISDLRLRHGEFAAIACADRAEATAILDRLAGLQRSEASWGEQRLADIVPAQLRSDVLVLDDNAFLFAEPLRDSVFAGEPQDEAQRRRIAHVSGIDEMLRGLDEGWDTELRLRGANLSGGQRQRVRLARALAYAPAVLLAMDPLSAVDAITEGQVAQRLRDARRGATTLLASNSTTVLGLADVVHFVDDGRVVASGTHAELAVSNERYQPLVSRGAWDGGPGEVES